MPNQHRVVFQEGEEEEAALEEEDRMQQGEEQQTPLTAYFRLNQQLGPAEAQKYTYETINSDYWYCKPAKEWRPRQQKRANHISRLGTVGATNQEAQVIFFSFFPDFYTYF